MDGPTSASETEPSRDEAERSVATTRCGRGNGRNDGCGSDDAPTDPSGTRTPAEGDDDDEASGGRAAGSANGPRRGRSWDGPSTGRERCAAADGPRRSPAPASGPGSEDRDLRAEWEEVTRRRAQLLRSLELKALEIAEYREDVSRAEEALLRRRDERERQRKLEQTRRQRGWELEQRARERLEWEQRARRQGCRTRLREQASRDREQRERAQREPVRREPERLEPTRRVDPRDARGLWEGSSTAVEGPSSDEDRRSSSEEEYEWDEANGPSGFATARRSPAACGARQLQRRPATCQPPPSVSSESDDEDSVTKFGDVESEYDDSGDDDDDDDRTIHEDYCY